MTTGRGLWFVLKVTGNDQVRQIYTKGARSAGNGAPSITGTLSKVMFPALRLGFVVGNAWNLAVGVPASEVAST